MNKEDFDAANWQDIISECNEKMCYKYSSEFLRKAREAEEKTDLKNKTIFQFLGLITRNPLIFDRERRERIFNLKNCIEKIDDQYNDQYIEILKELIQETSDAEMKARIADIIWIKKKDNTFAIIAIDSYIKSSVILEDPEKWVDCCWRIKRAIGLAKSLNNEDKLKSAVAHIETVLDKYNGKDPKYLSISLMKLLQEYKQGDPKKYVDLCKEIALDAEDNKNYHKAREAWETKVRWHRLAKEEVEAKESLKNMAETYVKKAKDDTNATSPNYINACINIEEAIKEFQKIGNEKKRIEELHKLLLKYQPKIFTQMEPIEFEIKIKKEEIEEVKKIVQGKSFQDSIYALSFIKKPPKVSKLREEVEKNAKAFPLAHIFGRKILNEEGKNIGKGEPMSTGEEDLESYMFEQAKICHLNYFLYLIDPIRLQINQDHNNVQIDDLLPIVSDNLFIPSGRECIYASGLYAGLKGDFLTSAHLLIPQLENSMRFILYHKGTIVSGFDKDGIQDEYDINKTLRMQELVEIIDEDTIFDLKGLLIEKNGGSNLRNKMAHGLISYSEYTTSFEIKYLWWITLNLCYRAKISSQRVNKKEQEQEQEGKTRD